MLASINADMLASINIPDNLDISDTLEAAVALRAMSAPPCNTSECGLPPVLNSPVNTHQRGPPASRIPTKVDSVTHSGVPAKVSKLDRPARSV